MNIIPWRLKDGTLVPSLPMDVYGFIYIIRYKNGKYYLGKKQVYKESKLTPLKNGNKRSNHLNYFFKGKGNKIEKVALQSNWKTYVGSSELTPPIEDITNRTIIALSKNKQTLTYLETKYLFSYDAIPSDKFYNVSIRPIQVYANAMSGAYGLSTFKEALLCNNKGLQDD